MHKDIEFIKYCVSKVKRLGWDIYEEHGVFKYLRPPFCNPGTETSLIKVLDSRRFRDIYFPLLLGQTCDALGIWVTPVNGLYDWYSNDGYLGEDFESQDEARIAAIKKYKEVEG